MQRGQGFLQAMEEATVWFRSGTCRRTLIEMLERKKNRLNGPRNKSFLRIPVILREVRDQGVGQGQELLKEEAWGRLL